MKNSWRKALSLFLCLVMCFSLLPVSAFAEGDEVTEESCPHTETVDVVTAPTCTEQGYTTHTCSACGVSYRDSFVEATGHVEMAVDAVEPTYEAPGCTAGTKCSVCGTILSGCEKIDQLVAEEPEEELEEEPELTKGPSEEPEGEPEGEPLRGVDDEPEDDPEEECCIIRIEFNGGTCAFEPDKTSTEYSPEKGTDFTTLSYISSQMTPPEGKVLTGWQYRNSNGNTQIYGINEVFTVTEDLTLYAVWEDDGTEKVTVIFDGNGGIVNGEAQLVFKVEPGKPLYQSVWAGIDDDHKVFVGWNTSADGSGTTVDEPYDFIPEKDTTIYAIWGKAFAITVHAGDGGLFSEQPDVSFVTDKVLEGDSLGSLSVFQAVRNEDPQKAVVGWYDNVALSGSPIDVTSYVPTGDMDLYPEWKSVWNLYFDADSSKGGYFDTYYGHEESYHVTVEQGQSFNTAQVPVLNEDTGLELTGWYSESGELLCAAGGTITPQENMYLKAGWPEIEEDEVYHLAFNAVTEDGGYFNDSEGRHEFYYTTVKRGESFNTAQIEIFNDDSRRELTGWCSADSGELLCEAGGSFTPGEDIKINAAWSEIDDEEGPVLSDYAEEIAEVLTVGDVISLSVNVTGDAAITEVKAVLWRHHNGIVGGWTGAKEIPLVDCGNGHWAVDYTLDGSELNGGYCVEYISAKDELGRTNSIYWEESFFSITGCTEDSEPPVITSFVLLESGHEINAGDTIHFTAEVSDDLSGIEIWYYGILADIYRSKSPAGTELTYVKTVRLLDIAEGVFSGSFTFDTSIAEYGMNMNSDLVNGYYFIELNPADNCGNTAEYIDRASYVHFIGGSSDDQRPTISDVELPANGTVVSSSDIISASARVEDESDINTVWVSLLYGEITDGSIVYSDFYGLRFELEDEDGDGVYSGSYSFEEDEDFGLAPDGLYMLSLSAMDVHGNTTKSANSSIIRKNCNENYIITFDGNGGGLASSPEADTYSAAVVTAISGSEMADISAMFAHPDGYELTGWQDESGELVCAIGGAFTPTKDTTLYAVWEESETDEEGPVITYITLPENGMNISGETVIYIEVKVEDCSGISFVTSTLTYSDNNGDYYSRYADISLDDEDGDGIYTGSYTFSADDPDGLYRLENIHAADTLYNQTSVHPCSVLFKNVAGSYAVLFDANGGYLWSEDTKVFTEIYSEGQIFYGYSYTPTNPDPHLAFSCWRYYDKDGNECFCGENDRIVIDRSMTLYAVWAEGWAVTLNANSNTGHFWDNTSTKILTVFKGNSFYARQSILNDDEDLSFKGWYEEAECINRVCGPDDSYTPASDITLYAGWGTTVHITLDANGGYFWEGNTSYTYSAAEGELFYGYRERPSNDDPSKAFVGWSYYDANDNECFLGQNDSVPVYSDMTLTAVWEEGYTVTLNANGGYFWYPETTVQTVVVLKGEGFNGRYYTVNNDDPHKAFGGWYYDKDCKKLACGPDDYFTPTGNVTLYAKWVQGYTVTLNANGGYFWSVTTLVVTEVVEAGYEFSARYYSINNADQHMAFNGWYSDKECTERVCGYDGLFIVNSDMTLYAGWTQGYIVTFNAGDGYFWDDSSLMTETIVPGAYVSALQYEPTPNDPAMAFGGWCYDIECTELACERGNVFYPDSDVTLYARWTSGITVTFDANGGYYIRYIDGRRYEVPSTSAFIPAGEPIRTYYSPSNKNESLVLAGWYFEKECKNRVDLNTYIPDGDITIYAKWGAGCFVTFNANGGYLFDEPGLTTYKIGVVSGDVIGCWYEAKHSDPDKVFAGWYYDAKCTKLASDFTKTVKITKSVTLYAKWVTGAVVVFNANGGTGSMKQQMISSGKETALLANSFKRTNYTFVGWSDADGNLLYTDKQKIYLQAGDAAERITLYAVWAKNSYRIVFNANGGTGDMSEESGWCEFDGTYTLPLNTFDRPGFEFQGWATSAKGKAVYRDGQNIKGLSNVNGKVINLYAVWAAKTYSISFVPYEGAPDAELVTMPGLVCGKNYSLKANSFTREGCYFTGWNTMPDGSGVAYKDKEKVSFTENMTLFAQWHVSGTYSITFAPYEGAPDEELVKLSGLAFGKTVTLKANSFKRSEYVFKGWSTDPNATAPMFANKAKVLNLCSEAGGSVTLYPVWEAKTFKVTYKNVTVTENPNPATFAYDEGLDLLDVSRPGCTFKGWYLDKNFTTKVTSIEAGTAKNITLYAWLEGPAYKYTIAFDGNEATSGKMSAMKNKVCGKDYTLTANKFKRTGYDFLGWTDENGRFYSNKAKVTDLCSADGDIVTLHAVWGLTEYTINYKNVAGARVPGKDKYTIEETYVLPVPVKEGYTFLGWYTTATFKNGTRIWQIGPGSTGNISLYAKWQLDHEPVIRVYYYRYDLTDSYFTMMLSYGADGDVTLRAQPDPATLTGLNFSWSVDKEGILELTPNADGSECLIHQIGVDQEGVLITVECGGMTASVKCHCYP